jgi:RNA polymerase sigma factor (sigma-70 family)
MTVAIPEDIERIFVKPGKSWSEEEILSVYRWLHEPQRLTYLLWFCRNYLGEYAVDEDAEDAWGDFLQKRLPSVIHTYDPDKGSRFWGYMCFCLKRECGHIRERIKKKVSIELPADFEISGEDEEFEVSILSADPPSVDASIELSVFSDLFQACLKELPENLREAFCLVILEDRSYNEAADLLKQRPVTVRVEVSRSKALLRNCLARKGWTR